MPSSVQSTTTSTMPPAEPRSASADARPPVKPRGRSYRLERQPSVFSEIADASVNLAIWRRRLPSHRMAELVAAASDGQLNDYGSMIHARRFDPLHVVSGLESERLRAWLAADMGMLVQLFATLAGRSRVSVSLSVVRDDCCRKFHVDNLRLRLITTYLGPGTEWLDDAAVRRAAMHDSASCPYEANAAIARSPRSIQRARPGDVLLMKGKRFSSTSGVVHRSPPIDGSCLVRVVFVANV